MRGVKAFAVLGLSILILSPPKPEMFGLRVQGFGLRVLSAQREKGPGTWYAWLEVK